MNLLGNRISYLIKGSTALVPLQKSLIFTVVSVHVIYKGKLLLVFFCSSRQGSFVCLFKAVCFGWLVGVFFIFWGFFCLCVCCFLNTFNKGKLCTLSWFVTMFNLSA